MWIVPNTLTRLNGSLDTEEITLESKEFFQTCASSLLARSKPMRWQTFCLRWKQGSWMKHLFGRIVKPSRQNHLRVEEWISSSLHIPANHFRQPGNEKAQKMKDICGLTSESSSEKPDLEYVSLKTSKVMSASDSEKSLPIWLISDTGWKAIVENQRGDYFRRLKSAPLTNGNGCLSWPTVTCPRSHCVVTMADCGCSQNKTMNWGTPRVTTNGGHPSPQCTGKGSRLEDQAAMWQTPEAQNSTGYQNQRNGEKTKRLGSQVLSWPTPASRDHRTPNSKPYS